jgi:hypothetical protein
MWSLCAIMCCILHFSYRLPRPRRRFENSQSHPVCLFTGDVVDVSIELLRVCVWRCVVVEWSCLINGVHLCLIKHKEGRCLGVPQLGVGIDSFIEELYSPKKIVFRDWRQLVSAVFTSTTPHD